MDPHQNRAYWFPAKKSGWGWGRPTSWHGWAVLLVFATFVVGGIPLIQVRYGNLAYLAYVVVCDAILVAICWLTGEPTAWKGRGQGRRS
jgi:hypothetical protein